MYVVAEAAFEQLGQKYRFLQLGVNKDLDLIAKDSKSTNSISGK